jgi:sugar phosphate isomerase/epimerase
LEEIKGEYITLHLGYFYDYAKRETHVQNSIKSINAILDAGFKPKVAIENLKPKSSVSEKYFVGGATGDFESIFNDIPDSRLVMCYDIGHAAFSWDICKTIEQFRKRIYCAHVHDNDGRKDHLGIGLGSIEWPKVLKCLNPNGLGGPVIVEVFGEQTEPSVKQLMKYVNEAGHQ